MASYVGENKEFERQVLAGELELELIPQGTLAERLRAGGAGIPGFYTRTGFGTKLTEGKETKKFGDNEYVLEPGITAEVSFVKAWKGDKSGNLFYRKTSRNFNPMIATCGKVCVAEVEQLVEIGELDPDQVHTPGIYVDRIIQGKNYEKRIEFRTVQGAAVAKAGSTVRDLLAKRAAQGIARRLLRQSRHRHSDAGGQLHSRRNERHAAIREWLVRHRPVSEIRRRRSRSDQRRQTNDHDHALARPFSRAPIRSRKSAAATSISRSSARSK